VLWRLSESPQPFAQERSKHSIAATKTLQGKSIIAHAW
jgi:hypothetical protein